MKATLIENCPKGFGVNGKVLVGIAKGLIRTEVSAHATMRNGMKILHVRINYARAARL